MVNEADVYKAPMCMVLKIPQLPRHDRNMEASSNDSKLHVLKQAYATKVSCARLLCTYLREHNVDAFVLVYLTL